MEDYKEKLRLAKEALDSGSYDKETIEYIFPELKENKDERIRKKVIDVLKLNIKDAESQMQASRGIDRTFEVYACNKVIAWLEKQGEQKPIDKVEQEEDAELTDFESALFSAFSDAWQEYLSGKEVNVAKWTKEHSAELLEVVREQKPAWSEDDEEMIECLNNCLDELEEANGWRFTYVNNKDVELCEVRNWLKSLKERMKRE